MENTNDVIAGFNFANATGVNLVIKNTGVSPEYDILQNTWLINFFQSTITKEGAADQTHLHYLYVDRSHGLNNDRVLTIISSIDAQSRFGMYLRHS